MRTCILSLSLAASLLAQTDAPQRLAARALGNTPMIDDVRELCDRIGGRPTGSSACERAIEWGAKKFRDAGIDHVTLEPFPVPALWLPGTAEASASAPERFAVRIAAAPMSVSTKGQLEARLVDGGEGTPESIAKLGATARGAIVLVHSKEMKTFDDLFAEYIRNPTVLDAAKKEGVAALLL